MVDVEEYARRGRRWALLFASCYLVFLVVPAYQQLTSRQPPVTRALVLGTLAVFVAAYLWFWLNLAFERVLPRQTVVLLVLMCAIGAGLILHDSSWLGVLTYCVVVAGAPSGAPWRGSGWWTLSSPPWP